MVFTGRPGDAQDFTNNPRLLVAAIDKFNGRKLRSATLERIENARVNPATGSARAGRRHRPDGSRVPRALDGELDPQALRVHGRRARPAQGAAADRRGRRLRHLRGDRSARIHGVVGAARHARRDRGGHPRQRQHLRDRSARARRPAATISSRWRGTVGDANAAVAAERAASVAGQPARAGRQHRRIRGREPQRPQRRLRSHRHREQQLLHARLLLEQRSPRRPLPEARGAREASRSARAQPQRLLRGARPRAVTPAASAERARAGRRPRRSAARCRWPACRSRCSPRRSRARRRMRRSRWCSRSTSTTSISSRRTGRSTSRSRSRITAIELQGQGLPGRAPDRRLSR